MSGADADERREWAVVALSAALILALTPVVVSMMVEAWETDGFVWQTAASLTVDRGYDIGLVVALPAGLALGWILLFVLDESKKVQAVIVPAFAVVFAGVVWSRGLWFGDTVDWSANAVPLAVSFVAGVVTGGGAGYLSHGRRRFERAGWLLYLAVTAAAVTALVQLAVEGELGLVEGVADGGATAALLFVLSVFVEYENERDVSIVATSEKPRATVVGGLCKTIRDENLNHKFRGEGAEKMIRALSSLGQKDEEMLPDLGGTVEFRYKDTTGLISRWVSVTAEGIDARYIERQMELSGEPRVNEGVLGRALAGASKPLRALAPPLLRGRRGRSGSLAERLDGSDFVLVTVSFSELVSDDDGWITETAIESLSTLSDKDEKLQTEDVASALDKPESDVIPHLNILQRKGYVTSSGAFRAKFEVTPAGKDVLSRYET